MPALLPAMSPNAVPPAPCDQRFVCEEGYGFVLEEDGFLVPPDYVGPAGEDPGRLVVAAANSAAEPVGACEGQERPVAAPSAGGPAGWWTASGPGCTTTACWLAGGNGAWSWS